MRLPEIRVGHRFGMLTVTGNVCKENARTKYEVICDCGNITNKSKKVLFNGNTKSCGCNRHSGLSLGSKTQSITARNFPPKSLVGIRFGMVIVNELHEYVWASNIRRVYWKVTCDCGKKVIKRQDTLKASSSCGCLIATKNKSRSLPDGKSVKNNLYKKLVASSVKRKLSVSITFEQFVEISSRNCHWCSAKPKLSNLRKGGISKWNCNGVDRVDNNGGYTINNCVPCCWPCNRAKRDMTKEEWIRYLYNLVTYRSSIGSNLQIDQQP